MTVDAVISGKEGLSGVEWLLRGRQPRILLRRVLREMLFDGETLGGCRLTRAKFRSGHKLTACFDVSFRATKAAAASSRPVVVTWTTRLKDAVANAASAAPFRQLSAEVPDWNMRVEAAPLDTRFPQLARLSDPVYAGQVAGDASIPEVRWLRYRPGQRHVLRYDFARPRAPVFLKLYRAEEDAQAVYENATQVAGWLADRGSHIASVRPLSLLGDDSAVVFPHAPGLPLSAWLKRPGARTSGMLERAGAALRLLQSMPAALAGNGPPRDFAAQAEATLRTSEHRAALLPGARRGLERLLDRIGRLEQRTGAPPALFAHGDFKTDHLYMTDARLMLIDFDSRCLADPGYDAGKFLADLRWRLSARGAACIEEAQARFLGGYAPRREQLHRIRLWEALMLAHLGWRRLPLFRRESTDRLEYMLGCADGVLTRLEKGCL
jgi:hypothetical protein